MICGGSRAMRALRSPCEASEVQPGAARSALRHMLFRIALRQGSLTSQEVSRSAQESPLGRVIHLGRIVPSYASCGRRVSNVAPFTETARTSSPVPIPRELSCSHQYHPPHFTGLTGAECLLRSTSPRAFPASPSSDCPTRPYASRATASAPPSCRVKCLGLPGG
jgi:hypothetical protein